MSAAPVVITPCNCESSDQPAEGVHSVLADELGTCRAAQLQVRFASTMVFTPDVTIAKRVVGVDLPGGGATAALLRACTSLYEVNIVNPIDADLDALAALPQLVDVGISGDSITAEMLLTFFEARTHGRLRSFACNTGTKLKSDRDVARVLSHPALESLESLSISKLGPIAAAVVSRGFDQLARLDSEFGSTGMIALAQGGGLQRLTELSAYGGKLDQVAIAALCRAGFSSRLAVLNLGATAMDAPRLQTMSSHPFPGLRNLSLHRNAIDTSAIRYLLEAPWHRQLTRLTLAHNHLDDTGQALLRGAPNLVEALRATGHWDEKKGGVYTQTKRRGA